MEYTAEFSLGGADIVDEDGKSVVFYETDVSCWKRGEVWEVYDAECEPICECKDELTARLIVALINNQMHDLDI